MLSIFLDSVLNYQNKYFETATAAEVNLKTLKRLIYIKHIMLDSVWAV